MKHPNLTLISINNTLHIKADNLEPVEVDSSCVDELITLSQKPYLSNRGELHPWWNVKIQGGLKIYELSDRIELRRLNRWEFKKAFLLPVKEDNLKKASEMFNIELVTDTNCKLIKAIATANLYTIEQIEKAIDEEIKSAEQTIKDFIQNDRSIEDAMDAAFIGFTQNIINNLTK